MGGGKKSALTKPIIRPDLGAQLFVGSKAHLRTEDVQILLLLHFHAPAAHQDLLVFLGGAQWPIKARASSSPPFPPSSPQGSFLPWRLKTHRHTQTHRHTDTQTHRHTDTQTHRHTDTQRHTQTHTDTHRHTHRHTQTHTQTHTDTHRHTQTHTDTHTQTHTDTHRHTQTHRHTDTQTHRHTDTQTHRQQKKYHALIRLPFLLLFSPPRVTRVKWPALTLGSDRGFPVSTERNREAHGRPAARTGSFSLCVQFPATSSPYQSKEPRKVSMISLPEWSHRSELRVCN